MKPIYPSMTPTWHNTTYADIQPSRPELSTKGKRVVVIGGGRGIGRAIAQAFVEAGSAHVYILGRTESILATSAEEMASPQTPVTPVLVDINDEEKLKDAAIAVGRWDILVLSAGYLSTPASLMESSPDYWWQNFESNVKGPMLVAKTFIPTACQNRPVLIGLTTGAVSIPPSMMPGSSGYITSKMAQIMLLGYIKAENPHLFVSNFHPGVIVTDMSRKAGNADGPIPKDDVSLPAHFAVWLASSEASFLDGRMAWANWDVTELKLKAEDIISNNKLTANIVGWPYPNM